MLLTTVQLGPVLHILGQIELLGPPEHGHVILVHLPDIVMLDGKDNEPVGIGQKEGLICLPLLPLCDGQLMNLYGIVLIRDCLGHRRLCHSILGSGVFCHCRFTDSAGQGSNFNRGDV